jgi:hypothetical protein
MKNLIKSKKEDAELQIVWGEVYAPNVPDSQGDFMTAEAIREMAYSFVKEGNMGAVDVMHDNKQYGCYIVESFIARDDDSVFIPGSWVVGVHIPNKSLWERVKNGELNGFSMEAIVHRVQTELEIDFPLTVVGYTDKVDGHAHSFMVRYDENGKFLGGITDQDEGHYHQIMAGTVTNKTNGHSHKFSIVEGVLEHGSPSKVQ